MTWRELVEQWTWALINDAEFLDAAYLIQREHDALALIRADLETP
jgi:hypothetical protein